MQNRQELEALVGTVCPACKSEILRRPDDGEVFCWDPYCGQQLDAYRGTSGEAEMKTCDNCEADVPATSRSRAWCDECEEEAASS